MRVAVITERTLIERMHALYRQRLNEVLDEADGVSKVTGKVLPSPGLKVRHKASGLEYTVLSIDAPKGGGSFKSITLMPPEAPRFEPTSGEAFIGEETPVPAAITPADKRMTHDQRLSAEMGSRRAAGPYEPIVISREEYEKDYEVR